MQKCYPALLAYAVLLAVLPLLLQAQAAAATLANPVSIMPPPGLYRVDLDATHAFVEPGTVIASHVDGATGATHQRQTARGQKAERDYAGTGPQTQCIKPYKNVPGMVQAVVATCPRQTSKIIDDHTLLSTAECPGSVTTIKITKIDDRNWQYDTRIRTTPTSQAPMNPMAGVESMLRLQAQHGATPEQREEAQQQLKAMPQLKKEAERQRIETMAELTAVRDKATDPQARERRHGAGQHAADRWADQSGGRVDAALDPDRQLRRQRPTGALTTRRVQRSMRASNAFLIKVECRLTKGHA